MRRDDIAPAGLYEQAFMLEPTVIRMQRQAELEQMAKYRATKLEHYKQWSKSQKEYLDKYHPNLAETLEKKLKENEGKQINFVKSETIEERLKDPNSFVSKLKITAIYKPIEQKWYQRILKWLT